MSRAELARAATEAVFAAIQQAAGVQVWSCHPAQAIRLHIGDHLLLPARRDDVFVHIFYKDANSLITAQPSIYDVYQAHSDLDRVDITCRRSGESDTSVPDEPVGSLVIGAEHLLPGERLAWLTPDGSHAAVFEAFDECRVLCRTTQPQVVAPGMFATWNMMTSDVSPACAARAREVFSLPIPRNWQPRNA